MSCAGPRPATSSKAPTRAPRTGPPDSSQGSRPTVALRAAVFSHKKWLGRQESFAILPQSEGALKNLRFRRPRGWVGRKPFGSCLPTHILPHKKWLGRQESFAILPQPEGTLKNLRFRRPRGWVGRIRTCECWDQNPVPYRLATTQTTPIIPRPPTPRNQPPRIVSYIICAAKATDDPHLIL